MKKNSLFLPLVSFVVGLGTVAGLLIKYGYFQPVFFPYFIFFLLFETFLFLYQKNLELIRLTFFIAVGVLPAVLLAGLVVRLPVAGIGWLVIIGLVSGLLTAAVTYHSHRLFLRHYQEAGIEYPLELALTFFSFSDYLILLYLRFSFIDAIQLSVFLLVVSFLLGIFVTAPIQHAAQRIAHAIKSGYTGYETMEIRLPIIGRLYDYIKDYFSHLEKAFAEMKDIGLNIKSSSESLSSASEEMNASLEEVSSTIQHISKGSQEQSSSISTIARSIEELNNLTSSISSQVKMASVSSRRTNESARQGMNYSVNVARLLKDIFEQTKIIEDKMALLRDEAIEIKKILDLIRGITEQTDLLALNAAIEAARVGEQGRGFAVVADEIRNLANETQRSSATVENLISEINKTTLDLNNLLVSERSKIVEANDLATQTEEQFTGIVKSVDLVTDMVTRINEAAGHQSDNTQELVKQVEQVAQVAGDTAAATEEVSAAVEQQTASMEEFTSTAQLLANVASKLEELLKSTH